MMNSEYYHIIGYLLIIYFGYLTKRIINPDDKPDENSNLVGLGVWVFSIIVVGTIFMKFFPQFETIKISSFYLIGYIIGYFFLTFSRDPIPKSLGHNSNKFGQFLNKHNLLTIQETLEANKIFSKADLLSTKKKKIKNIFDSDVESYDEIIKIKTKFKIRKGRAKKLLLFVTSIFTVVTILSWIMFYTPIFDVSILNSLIKTPTQIEKITFSNIHKVGELLNNITNHNCPK